MAQLLKTSSPLNILVSAFACGPNWGSEVGMGWNWIVNLANYCALTVITETGFKDEIETSICLLELKYAPKFHYINVGKKGRELFWKQGDWRFYTHYNKWQKKAFHLAKDLIQKSKYDIVHQLNLIGYREPGYLWKLNIPFVWGPLGGHAQVPINFLFMLGKIDFIKYSIRNILNFIQMKFSRRVIETIRNSDAIISATREGLTTVSKFSKIDTILDLIPETGTIQRINFDSKIKHQNRLKLSWCGYFMSTKLLPLALFAISKSKYKDYIELHIIGDGPERAKWKKLAIKLKITEMCIWHGRVKHEKALDLLKDSDALLFTSVRETSSTVVLEAIENGTPVICHDLYGFGLVITNECGIKFPAVSTAASINKFKEAIDILYESESLRNSLSIGAIKRSQDLTWDQKAKQVFNIYKQALKKVSND